MIFLGLGLHLFSQKVVMIHQGLRPDSSYYHIEKIDDNEFWVGGEYGILKKVDSLGNVSNISYPNEGIDILKVKKIDKYIYLLTANAVIYRYDIKMKTFLRKEFTKFKNRCFYDIIPLKEGQLLVCGGASGIAEGKKKIPKGFIAIIDRELTEISTVWKNKRKFVWALLNDEEKNAMAVTFNGLNTKVIYSLDLKKWKKAFSVKGLVHDLKKFNDRFWYSGTKSFRVSKNGMLGVIGDQKCTLKDNGCLWKLDQIKGEVFGVTYSGDVIQINDTFEQIKHLNTPKTFSLYDIERISETLTLVVGRGKTIMLLKNIE